MKLKKWVRQNVEVLILTLLLLATAPLMAWWAILMHSNFVDMHEMQAQLLLETRSAGAELNRQLAELDTFTKRKLFMVWGEASLACLLFLTSAVVLFALARRRGVEYRRMQSLLQLTTHELKTPLAAIRALLQSLQLGSIPAERRMEMLRQGLHECNRLEHLAETTLAYQRSVAKATNRSEVLETSAFLKALLLHRSQTFPDVFHQWTPPAHTTYVKADADSLRVILENLLDNARKYGGGEICLEEKKVGALWKISIRDKGQGFEPQYAEALFEPFVRLPGKHSHFHGNGLGLYLSRRLAQGMGGKLYARSEGLGKGSCFVLEIPLATEQEMPKAQAVNRE
ncbi:MAG: HAMP domain-containing histidine kinase [Cystobacterineae bacterium]|nr:HAMP domain-containing histidine kinase [Cystobacterineae bacterium]